MYSIVMVVCVLMVTVEVKSTTHQTLMELGKHHQSMKNQFKNLTVISNVGTTEKMTTTTSKHLVSYSAEWMQMLNKDYSRTQLVIWMALMSTSNTVISYTATKQILLTVKVFVKH